MILVWINIIREKYTDWTKLYTKYRDGYIVYKHNNVDRSALELVVGSNVSQWVDSGKDALDDGWKMVELICAATGLFVGSEVRRDVGCSDVLWIMTDIYYMYKYVEI